MRVLPLRNLKVSAGLDFGLQFQYRDGTFMVSAELESIAEDV